MTDPVFDDIDEVLPPDPNGELVHWMAPRPLTVGTTGLAVAASAAFAFGVIAALGTVALIRWMEARAEAED